MTLAIETYSNVKGGNAFFKAVSHPLAARRARALVGRLAADGPAALYDPLGMFDGFAELYDLAAVNFTHAFVQDITRVGRAIAGCGAEPVTALAGVDVRSVFIAAFDAGRLTDHIRHLLPAGAVVRSLDDIRIDDALLSNRRQYLDPINFATNFAFFRDNGRTRTRIVTANYWAGYGAHGVSLHLILFDGDGAVLAEWDQPLADTGIAIVIDSRAVRAQFGLGPFTGQLFIHATGITGHDVVKYALDVWRDDGSELSCSHDANAWPSDRYGGLPAPREGEEVVLWVQNSTPCPVPAGAVGLNLMGDDEHVAWLGRAIAPWATCALSVAELLPQAHWPQQVEVRAGKHFVRPRYEVSEGQHRHLAHVNVERADLAADPKIPELANLLGKGYLLPAPVLPTDRWRSIVLPTPMATCQNELPVAVLVMDATGREVARHRFGRLPRHHAEALDVGGLLAGDRALPSGYGHMELVYDFSDGGAADGWLHGLFRYEDVTSGDAAETSFGAHIFNSVMVYKGEPQSYTTRPPGLSTRLFLRLGSPPFETMCHLIYPSSTPWHRISATRLILYDGNGEMVAARDVAIPCGGSMLWRYGEMFDAAERRRAGDAAYVIIRDTTCRLFGYHGLLGGAKGPFSLDHMFGF